MVSRPVHLSIGALLVVACASSSRPPGVASDASPTRADAAADLAGEPADAAPSAAEFASRYCALLATCCTDQDRCRQAVAAMSPFRPALAGACLGALGAGTPQLCTAGFAAASAACQRVFATKVASQRLGQPCAQTEDCLLSPQGPVRCAGEAGMGRCQVVLPGTEESTPCVATASGPVTVPGGDPTASAVMGYVCSVASGLWCDDGSGKCAASKPIGAACTSFGECGAAGYCDDATGKCVARKSEGAPCDIDEACPSTVCGEDNKCAPPPAVDPALVQLCSRP